ncbi:hypothetical protein IJ596_08190 [bacterium]|nr:hypothetical protein [bacterium]
MTKVENVNVQTSQNKYRPLRHAANAAVTVGGVGATGYLLKKGMSSFNKLTSDTGEFIKTSDKGKFIPIPKLKIVPTKLGETFTKLGEKIFNPNNKYYGKYIEKAEKWLTTFDHLEMKEIPAAKGKMAMLLTAGVVALGFIVRGIYKAGKINGDK